MMSEIIQLLQGALKEHSNYTPLLLKALDEQQLQIQKSASFNSTVSKINSLLNTHGTKAEGYTLLKSFLSHCNQEILNETGLVWISAATKTCTQRNQFECIALAFDVISLLIERSVGTSEFHKQITHTMLQKIFEAAYNVPENAQIASLNCLILCMLSYPGPCGPSKNMVEKIAYKYIDSGQNTLIQRSGICLLLMQQTRSGGEAGIMHKKYFTEFHVQIIGSLHYYFNILFENVEENYDIDEGNDGEKLKLPELQLSHEPVVKITQISQRILNLLSFLKEALSGPYPVPKVVRPNQILGLIRRGLDINSKSVEKYAILDNIILASILPQIHVKLFEVLDAFIDLLQGNVRLFCNEILSLLKSSLKWTFTGGMHLGTKKPYKHVRSATYHSLKIWCIMLGSGSLVENIADTLVENIIEDTSPFKSQISLQVHMKSGRNLLKRARKKLQKSRTDSTSLSQQNSIYQQVNRFSYIDEHNVKLCLHALDGLSAFLQVAGYTIKPNLQQILQQHIIQLCLNIQGVILTKTNLYFPNENRVALYKALYAIIMYPHHLSPPPLQYGILILTNAKTHDFSQEVREICQTLLGGLDKIMHPQRSTPFFKPSLNELVNALNENREVNESFEQENDIDITEDVIELDDSVHAEKKSNTETIIEKSINIISEGTRISEQKSEYPYIVSEKIEEVIDIEGDDQDLCMITGYPTVETMNVPIYSVNIQKSHTNETTDSPQKRVKVNEEKLLIDQLADTFVPE